jgi:signal transduction histidine kinase
VVSGMLVTYAVTLRFDSIVVQTQPNTGYPSHCTPDRVCLIVSDEEIIETIKNEFVASATTTILVVLVNAAVITLFTIGVLVIPRLRTIEELTRAASLLSSGNRHQRVSVRSPDEIGELARSFNAMADSLERVEHLRHAMVGDIAHELRTPLSNIQGYMEGLRDGVITPKPELFESLHQEANLLTRLVNDLQTLALADAGQLNLHRVSTSLAALVKHVLITIRDRPSPQPTLIVKSLDHLPRLHVDPDRIKQVIANLINNALAHTPPNGRITLDAYRDGDWVWVSIHDTGKGISPQHLPYVFERFYRVDASRTRATGGTGIGLAIVRQLVHAHGGTVEVESELGVGSTFCFSLPILQTP